MEIRVIGGGLAGSEACYQLLKRGYNVKLYEMRKVKQTPCHTTADLCELVCSNSLKSMENSTASGTLKQELKTLDCLLLKCAEKAKVPSGGALAVNRKEFSKFVEEELNNFSNFERIDEEYVNIDKNIPTIIATGPLTSDLLAENIAKLIGNSDNLHFYDAVAPIISGDSLDYSKLFFATRYDKGEPSDYLNCGMNKQEYEAFYNELVNGKVANLHEFEKGEIFESCMPIEVMAKRGADTIRYGMMKPVGIKHPETGEKYYAVVQLRKENVQGSAYNLVGFQTNLTFPEQRRIFSLLPGLENAEFLRYGVIHRNTFLNSPEHLDCYFKLKNEKNIYFAGQITGVEGYVESMMSGLIASINLHCDIIGKDRYLAPESTIIGSLQRHISTKNVDFEPMNANFGILPPLDSKIRDKKLRKLAYYERSLKDITEYNKQFFNKECN